MDGYTHTREPAGDALLLTGATGFLGQEILLRYLERSERPIYALIRADNDLQATERMRSILTFAVRRRRSVSEPGQRRGGRHGERRPRARRRQA